MEGFVRAITAGGIGVVAGSWLVELSSADGVAWWIGGVLVAVGAGSVLYGIGTEIDRPAS